MAEPFNRDGPVKVNQTDYAIYQTIFGNEKPSIARLVEFWLDEHHLDGVRRLAIRDAIRQPFAQFRSNPYTYYRTHGHLQYICSVLVKQEIPDIQACLKYRPKLVNEITGEFLYALQNDRFIDRPRDQNSIDELIGYLVKLTDEQTGRSLILYHSVWRVDAFYTNHTEFILDGIVDPTLPDWLHADLWKKLQTNLQPEITACEKALQSATKKRPDHPINSLRDLSRTCKASSFQALLTTSQFIGRYPTRGDYRNYSPLVPIIDFLEANLPRQLTYNEFHEMVMVTVRLFSDRTVYNYTRRHILNTPEEILTAASTDECIFLFGTRSITARDHPEDFELLAKLDSCIDKIHSQTE